MYKYLLVACLLTLAITVVIEAQPRMGCGSITSYPLDATKYVEVVNGQGIIRDCAVGTKFSKATCSCSERVPVAMNSAGSQAGMAQTGTAQTSLYQRQVPWWLQQQQQRWGQWNMWPFNWNDMMNYYFLDAFVF